MSSSVRPPTPSASRRRRILAILVGFVAVVLVVVAVLLGSGHRASTASADGGSARSTSASGRTASPVPSRSPAPTPVATGPTGDATQAPRSLRPVNLAATAAVGNGVSAQITSLEAIHGTGIGPGNISGPALRVTVVVHNGTAAPVSLDGVSVEMTSGDDLQPAPPLDDPSQRPLAGMVGPGKAEQGAYVFRISEDRRSSVTVTVGYQAGAPIMVFTGAAG